MSQKIDHVIFTILITVVSYLPSAYVITLYYGVREVTTGGFHVIAIVVERSFLKRVFIVSLLALSLFVFLFIDFSCFFFCISSGHARPSTLSPPYFAFAERSVCTIVHVLPNSIESLPFCIFFYWFIYLL